MKPQLSHRDALDLICATIDVNGHPVGHWHGVAIKVARAAIFGHAPDLSEKDLVIIRRNLPPGKAAEIFRDDTGDFGRAGSQFKE